MKKGRKARPLEERWPGIIERTKELAKRPITEADIAESFGVSARTIYHWKQRNIVFASVLNEGKQTPDQLMEESLWHQGMGYYYEEESPTKDGSTWVVKYQPPSEKAASRWLLNRRPDRWRDKIEQEVKLSYGIEIETSRGTDKV